MANSAVGIAGLIQSLRDGRSLGSFGDLIDALDFHLTSGTQTTQMSQELAVTAGKTVTVTVRFKSPTLNNDQRPVASFESGVRDGAMRCARRLAAVTGLATTGARAD